MVADGTWFLVWFGWFRTRGRTSDLGAGWTGTTAWNQNAGCRVPKSLKPKKQGGGVR